MPPDDDVDAVRLVGVAPEVCCRREPEHTSCVQDGSPQGRLVGERRAPDEMNAEVQSLQGTTGVQSGKLSVGHTSRSQLRSTDHPALQSGHSPPGIHSCKPADSIA